MALPLSGWRRYDDKIPAWIPRGVEVTFDENSTVPITCTDIESGQSETIQVPRIYLKDVPLEDSQERQHQLAQIVRRVKAEQFGAEVMRQTLKVWDKPLLDQDFVQKAAEEIMGEEAEARRRDILNAERSATNVPESVQEAALDVASQVLQERGKTYGNFLEQATLTCELKKIIESRAGWDRLAPDQRESMMMFCVKIARIINGDPNYADNWRDIEGYARLVADRLDGVPER